jgi:hypothetical protein
MQVIPAASEGAGGLGRALYRAAAADFYALRLQASKPP